MAFTDSPETKLVPNMPFADYCKAHGVNQKAANSVPEQMELTGEFSDLLRPEMDAHFYRPVKQPTEREDDHAEY